MTSTEPAPSALDRLSKQRLYRRVMVGCIVVGAAAMIVFRDALGYPLLGEVVYWLGILGFFAVWWLSPVTLFDERDCALERRASHLTLLIVAPVLVVGAAVARILPQASSYAMPATVWPAFYAYASVFVVFGVVYLVLRYRP